MGLNQVPACVGWVKRQRTATDSSQNRLGCWRRIGGSIATLALIGGIYTALRFQPIDSSQTTTSVTPSSTLQPKNSPKLTPSSATATLKTFADWCLNKNELPPSQHHTIDVLMKEVEAQDCTQAEKKLSVLTVLELKDKKIVDVAPLSSLKNLEKLNLDPNQINDVSPLSSLINLKELVLSGNNQIKNLSSLSSLPNLMKLHLDRNKVDVRQLLSLSNLTNLSVSQASIENINLLSSLTNLTELHLIGNSIKDISPLGSLTRLTYLDLSNNQIKDVSSLSNLKSLKVLQLNGNPLVDVAPLSSLTNLKDLYLKNSSIKDLSPLSSLTNLEHLYLTGNPIANKTCPVLDPQNKTCVF